MVQSIYVLGNAAVGRVCAEFSEEGRVSRDALREFLFFSKLESNALTCILTICRDVPSTGLGKFGLQVASSQERLASAAKIWELVSSSPRVPRDLS